MKIAVKKLQIEDATALFAFELKNKSYFEQFVPPRDDDYYHFELFLTRLESLLEEQAQGMSHFYLIKDENESILGRVNIVDIEEIQGVGYLGYRVGQHYAGKGIASIALKKLLEDIVEEGVIKQIKAKTTSNNIASQRVLEKNGFERMQMNSETVEMNGERLEFVHYRWTAG